jgi:hypothetical protein
MYLIVVLLNLLVLLLLIIGIINPQKSLFWIKGEKTRMKSIVIYLILFFTLGGIGGLLNPNVPLIYVNTRFHNLLNR